MEFSSACESATTTTADDYLTIGDKAENKSQERFSDEKLSKIAILEERLKTLLYSAKKEWECGDRLCVGYTYAVVHVYYMANISISASARLDSINALDSVDF